jgi:hypothetical protein
MFTRTEICLLFVIMLAGCGRVAGDKSTMNEDRPFSGMFPILEEGKLGYIDASGTILVRPQFAFHDSGLLNEDPYSEGVAPFPSGAKWGFVDEAGRYVINPQYDAAFPFSNGIARVRVGERYGFIDHRGGYLINPQFDQANDFTEGLAAVRIGEKWGYVNESGSYVVNPQFDMAIPFRNSLARVNQNGRWGFISRKGRFEINPQFDEAGDFENGVAVVNVGGRWGAIDKRGDYLIQPQFDGASERFAEGVWRISIGGKWGYVDPSGKIVINPQFDSADDFADGLARVQSEHRWGYIDHTGNYRVRPQFDGAEAFSEGMARVQVGNRFGFIDQHGKLAIPAQYPSAAYRFRGGRAWVIMEDGLGYIDMAGQYVRRPSPAAQPKSLRQLDEFMSVLPQDFVPSLLASVRGRERDFARDVLPARMSTAKTIETIGMTLPAMLNTGSTDHYVWIPEPGSAWSALVASPDFDTFLTVYLLGSDGSLTEVGSNDDFRSMSKSRVDIGGISRLNIYIIEVRSYNPASAGRYALTVGSESDMTRVESDSVVWPAHTNGNSRAVTPVGRCGIDVGSGSRYGRILAEVEVDPSTNRRAYRFSMDGGGGGTYDVYADVIRVVDCPS